MALREALRDSVASVPKQSILKDKPQHRSFQSALLKKPTIEKRNILTVKSKLQKAYTKYCPVLIETEHCLSEF